jgi:shikimate kinase / 3-dehydroquinate synthase
MLKRFIFLYGPPASGKSVCGKALSTSLGCPFYDLDSEIEIQAGRTIPEIFIEEGEDGFREREKGALQDLVCRPAGVVALGGGALLREESRHITEEHGLVFCLTCSPEIILKRLAAGNGGRPLLDGDQEANLRQLLASRQDHYGSFSNQLVTDDLPVDEVTWQIQVQMGRFRIKNMGPGYDVHLFDGGLGCLGELIEDIGLHAPAALVSDENVADFYLAETVDALQSSGISVYPIVLPAGEEHKTFQTAQRILEGFVAAGLDRSSTVIALGGGVIGDLTGFASAIYMRGVRWVTVPTSLLAMVDASLGGKTGVDLPQGKNLAGAFHPPQLVLVDPKLLKTLPEIDMRNGLGEVVKHAVLADPELYERCQSGYFSIMDDPSWVVRRAMAVKVCVIEEDPYEHGRRASLNFGHTLGHGLELASGYRLKHGEGVSIGMVAAARLSSQMGLAQSELAVQLETCLQGLGLPTRIPPGIDRSKVIEAMSLDKKRRLGRPRIVLPIRIGEVRWDVEIDDFARLVDVMG